MHTEPGRAYRPTVNVSAAQLGLLLLLILLPATTSLAQDFTYSIENDEVTITGYTGPGGNVEIPATIEGLPVTAIGQAAFSNISQLLGVTIPDGVIDIGEQAFSFSTSMVSVSIGGGVTNIGTSAFNSCTALSSINIPGGVPMIGDATFSRCSSLPS
ncbi:MAG: leucine-rich repeat domain-containing protein, partial [Verrucomicrobiales bacterium]